jgi:hypothetical protein
MAMKSVDFRELFRVIQQRYGTGADGKNGEDFNLPDYRGLYPGCCGVQQKPPSKNPKMPAEIVRVPGGQPSRLPLPGSE